MRAYRGQGGPGYGGSRWACVVWAIMRPAPTAGVPPGWPGAGGVGLGIGSVSQSAQRNGLGCAWHGCWGQPGGQGPVGTNVGNPELAAGSVRVRRCAGYPVMAVVINHPVGEMCSSQCRESRNRDR